MRISLGWLGLFAGLVVGLVAGVTPASAAIAFDDWLNGLRRDALARGIAPATFDAALSGVRPNPRIIELDRRQPEFTQTFWTYLDQRISSQRVSRGQALLEQHRPLLEAVHRRYGVPPRFLVAFWGLESNFGDFTGDHRLFSSLATLAHDGRRGAFFREQLLAALELVERGDIPARATASWAGAMGQPQFMPTTYRDFAVDFDGSGRRDLWGSLADVFASSANYLTKAGWDPAYTWGREVRISPGFDYAVTGLDNRRSLLTWQQLGVRQADGSDLPAADIAGSVIFPGGAGRGPAFVVYGNFHTIMAWNRSILYAVSVGHLADRLAGDGPLRTPRPAQAETPLSRREVMEIQRRLVDLGYDTGGVDGLVGQNTRSAIRSFQQQAALPADGFPTLDLLERLRTATASP
ncbi:MAG: lytic murein transglycosylase [Rhodospirillales bacterium]|nr:MAG: lytic murein transglycosylase [Rhodospirillales bacterium]